MSEGRKPKINRKAIIYGFFAIMGISVASLFWLHGADLGEEKQRLEAAKKEEEERLAAMNAREEDAENRALAALQDAQAKAQSLPPPPQNGGIEAAVMMQFEELNRSRKEIERTAPSDQVRQSTGLYGSDQEGAPNPSRGGARTGFVIFVANPEDEKMRLSLKTQETEEMERRQQEDAKKQERVKDDMASGRGMLYHHNDKVETQDVNTARRVDGTHWLAPGTVIRAVLLNAIDTSNPGLVTAKVAENVYDSRYGRYLVIPAGSTIMGTYSNKVDYYTERVEVRFGSLTTPGGAVVALQNAYGADQMGVSGVPGDLHTHLGKRLLAATLGVVGVELVDRHATKSTQTVTQGGMTTTKQTSPAVDVVSGFVDEELKRFSSEPFKITAEAGTIVTITLSDGIEIPPVANRR